MKPTKNKGDQQFQLACVQVVMMLVQHIEADPTWFVPPEDGDWLRTALVAAGHSARMAGHIDRADKIEKILWEPIRYTNTYRCSECDETWTDQWTGHVDTECPECGADVSPVASERVTPKAECACAHCHD